MLQSPTAALPCAWQMSTGSVLRAVFVAMIGALLILAHSLALTIMLGLALAMGLALQERISRLERLPTAPAQTYNCARVVDGGSLGGVALARKRPMIRGVSVLDGGSLEHHSRERHRRKS